ncbi:hypothetical protein ACFFWC_00350 [Plantactinospora siamensis]|uniref:Uncharacterized protein n=1 Tax=Plantactinospora siamensis TaxID=555372 RepID=A0ABV6NTT7_9ACTN
MTPPAPGECVLIDAAASVQFAGDRALVFRVVSIGCTPTYHGWAWITGYVLDDRGMAREKREVYVYLPGLRPTEDPANRRTVVGARRPVIPAARRPGSDVPAEVPASRPAPAARTSRGAAPGQTRPPARTLVAAGRR